MTEMLVRRYQQLVPILLRPVQQRTVVQARPAAFENRIHVMPGQIPAQRRRYTLIEQVFSSHRVLEIPRLVVENALDLPTLHAGKPA